VADITIANLRDLPPVSEWPEWWVYIGRESKRRGLKASPLANPFGIGAPRGKLRDYGDRIEYTAGKASRDDVIGMFREWLMAQTLPMVVSEQRLELARLLGLLARHGKLVLVCWCAPKACHGEVIREALGAGGRGDCLDVLATLEAGA
jgi:hypothetical protein